MAERETTGRVERYLADELVVATAHEGLVLKKLEDLRVDPGARPGDIERSPELGLTKLRFTSAQVDHGVQSLELMTWNQFGSAFSQDVDRIATDRGGIQTVSPVDKLLLGLRKLFAADHDRWTPVMGKNRFVERVIGQPWVSGGAEGDPQPPGPTFQPFPARGLEPGQGVRIGILDTRIETHPWLNGAFIARSEAIESPLPARGFPAELFMARPERNWWLGHGTFVAGLILQAAQGAVVELHEVLDTEGDGDTWTVANELVNLVHSGVDLVNLSLGTFTDDGQPPLVLQRAVERLGSRIVIVAAAGNHGNVEVEPKPDEAAPRSRPNSALWPAALPDVIAVGAVDGNRANASFSPLAPWVDVSARGVKALSTYLTGRVKRSLDTQEFTGYAIWSGTSFAAAIVSGAIAARIRPGSRGGQEVVQGLLASGERDQDGRPFVDGPGLRG